MRKNEEVLAFHEAVYSKVREIPRGKVTSYGHILKLIYRPQNSRQVGISLKQLNLSLYPDVPWWRVVNYKGVISPREGGIERQITRLEEEGVPVLEYTDGSRGVDINDYGWYPETEFDEIDSD